MPLYAGMTVNERLVIAGKWPPGSAAGAVAKGDRAKMIEALTPSLL
jgi:hypothetical protein